MRKCHLYQLLTVLLNLFGFISVSAFAQTEYSISSTGFDDGYASIKTQDIESLNATFRIRTNVGDENALYLNTNNIAVNIDGNVNGITEVFLEFTRGEKFDIKSLDMVSDADRNYVFTPLFPSNSTHASGQVALTLNASKLEFNAQVLNFTGITSLSIRREDGEPIKANFLDNFLIQNIKATIDTDGSITAGERTDPVLLGTSTDNSSQAVNVFDFTLSDGGSLDGRALEVKKITMHVNGTASDAERSGVAWLLVGDDVDQVQGTYDAAQNVLTFDGLGLSIPDGTSKKYHVHAYFEDINNVIHESNILFSLNSVEDLTLHVSSTRMNSTSIGEEADINNVPGSIRPLQGLSDWLL